MLLELAEALDCPRCRDGYGLVTFVTRADRRRVLAGHLGCPMCEVEFRVEGGTIRFGHDAVEETTAPARDAGEAPPGAGPGPTWDPQTPVRVAGLLGLGEGPGRVVLLGPGLGPLAIEVAGLAGRVEILAWLEDGAGPAAWGPADLARGVNPVRGADPARWPVRAAGLDGVALARPDEDLLEEAIRALRPDGRLVVLEPGPGAREALAGLGVEELASDPSAWVGRRR